MGAEELEDYLEFQDPYIREQIAKSNADIAAVRTRPARVLLDELRKLEPAKPKRSPKR